ncbi:MAG: hypothetical protein IAE82_18540 [Opitutaceae bacterium]|nr:hypothetical protein [Opitutaceae bacterium]
MDMDVAEVDAGWEFTAYRKNDGTLWVTGRNNQGQLGDGSTTDRDVPMNLTSGVSVFSTGAYHLVYVKTDGTLWGVGGNSSGALGTGNTTHATSPVQIASGVSSASAGDYLTAYVKADGTLWGMGQNSSRIFASTGAFVATPVQLASDVSRAWAGRDHILFLKTDGTLWGMGENQYGQLGDGTNTDRTSPVRIAANVLFAEAGTERSFYVRNVDTPVVAVVPENSIVAPGAPVTLQANASGEGSFEYEWFRGASGDTTQPIPGATASTYTTPALDSDARYWVRVTSFAGSTDSSTVDLTLAGPRINVDPVNQTPTAGEDLTLSVTATAAGGAALTYQWYFGDALIDGATEASLTIRSAQAFQAGSYSVVVSAGGYTRRSAPAVVSVAPAPASGGRLVNLSTRALDLEGENQLIPGFVLSGAGTKRVLIRGVGPSLTRFGVSGVLVDPRIEVKRGSATVAENDDWETNANRDDLVAVSRTLGAFSLTAGSRDSALLLDLPPGEYTVPTPGVAGATGVALVELYDADADTPTVNLVNMSNRGFVGTGDNIMIPGVVISEHGSRTLLVRAVGPRLSRFGVAGVLADPRLTIYRRVPGNPPVDEIIHTNDNWGDAANAATTAQVATQVSAFGLDAGSKDAALVVTLKPGLYTVQATGVGDSTGVALVEVYLVP